MSELNECFPKIIPMTPHVDGVKLLCRKVSKVPMATVAKDRREFWKDLPAVVDYFGPVIARMQGEAGISTDSILRNLGRTIAQRVSKKFVATNGYDLVKELADFWTRLDMGRIVVERTEPLRFTIHDCIICGQTPEGSAQFRCAMHEGFLQQIVFERLGPHTSIHEVDTPKDSGGMWGRTFEIE